MRHSEVHSDLGDYLEGDLPLDRRALVDAHLDSCDACAGRLHELRATVDALRTLGEVAPPPDLARAVMARIAAGEGRPPWAVRLARRVPAPLRGRLVAPVVALASAAVVAVWLRAPANPTIEPVVPAPTAQSLADAIERSGRFGAAAEDVDEEAVVGPRAAADELSRALGSPSAWLGTAAALEPRARGELLAMLAKAPGSAEGLRSLAAELRRLSDPRAPAIADEIDRIAAPAP